MDRSHFYCPRNQTDKLSPKALCVELGQMGSGSQSICLCMSEAPRDLFFCEADPQGAHVEAASVRAVPLLPRPPSSLHMEAT